MFIRNQYDCGFDLDVRYMVDMWGFDFYQWDSSFVAWYGA